jgi:hypothetical protein
MSSFLTGEIDEDTTTEHPKLRPPIRAKHLVGPILLRCRIEAGSTAPVLERDWGRKFGM